MPDKVAFSLGTLPVFLKSNSDAGMAAGVFFDYGCYRHSASVLCVPLPLRNQLIQA